MAPPADVNYQAPPGAYQVPVGGYAAPEGSYAAPVAPVKRSPILGFLALIMAGVAALITPIIAGVAAYEMGRRVPEISQYIDRIDPDSLAFLAPVRDQVLWLEISFWTGTVLGVAAIVFGIIAIVKRSGRGAAIAALILAVLGAVIFFIVVSLALGMGATAGAIGMING